MPVPAIIINTKDEEGLTILSNLAKHMGYSVKVLSSGDSEDIGFGAYMDKVKSGKTVSRDKIIKSLTA